jgi:hypothetical protein
MKTLALAVMLVLSVNATAAVCISDPTPYEVDPWELMEEVEEEIVTITSGSFNA